MEVEELLENLVRTSTPRGNVAPTRATGLLPYEQATFHNVPPPQVGILTERPEHYAILVMLAKGMTQREVHLETGWSETWVSQIARQPWAKERLFAMMSAQGKNIINEMLRLEVIPSIQKLVDLRDNSGNDIPASVQARAADSLLDRYLGKAVQKVESYDGGKAPGLKEAEQLDSAIEAARLEIERLQGKKVALIENHEMRSIEASIPLSSKANHDSPHEVPPNSQVVPRPA